MIARSHEMLATFIRALEWLEEAVKLRKVVVLHASMWITTNQYLSVSESVWAFQHVWYKDPVKIIHPIDPTCNVARVRP